jgi:ABC-type dipeptide/oligopeptide/nickel transport system permease subunit
VPLILGCLSLFFPRLVIVLLAVFSDYIGRAYGSEWWWPVLGFFFMPFTTLAYAFSVNYGGGVSGMYLVLVVVAVLLDLGVIGGNARVQRKRTMVVKRQD